MSCCRLFLLFCCSWVFVSAQYYPRLVLQRFWGTEQREIPRGIYLASDGTLYGYGAIEVSSGQFKGVVVAIDTGSLEVRWVYQWKGSENTIIHKVFEWEGDHLAFVGQIEKEGRDYDYWFGILSKEGELVQQFHFGGSKRDVALSGGRNKFGGAYLAGYTWSQDGNILDKEKPPPNMWTLILNQSGGMIRDITLGGDKEDYLTCVSPTRDGGFIVGGVTHSSQIAGESKFYGDIYVMKVDFAGNVQWYRTFSHPYDEEPHSVLETAFGSYIIVGYRYDEKENKQFWAAKLDRQGNVVFEKWWDEGIIDELMDVVECPDGGFLFVGYAYHNQRNNFYVKGRKDIWAIRVSPQGDVIWKQTFGGPDNEVGIGIVRLGPNRYILLGEKENHFNPEKKSYKEDFWFVKIEELPCSTIKPYFVMDAYDYRVKPGRPVKFINQSKEGDRWLWDFGDGTLSTEHSPVKIYYNEGAYTIRLTVFKNETCRETYFQRKPLLVTPY